MRHCPGLRSMCIYTGLLHRCESSTDEACACVGAGQAEALDLELSVQETLERAASDAQLDDIKALLGRMMFTGRSVHKKVAVHTLSCSFI